MTFKLQELSAIWLAAKEAEKEAVENRRIVEDEIVRLLEIKQEEDGSRKIEAGPYLIKIACRLSRKVDGDIAQEIADEHDLQDYLSMLFRWKPELNARAWDSVTDGVRAAFSTAITTTPGRPSFTITKE